MDEFEKATPRPWFADDGNQPTICTKGGLALIRGEAHTVEDGERARFIADVRGPGPGFPSDPRTAADAALIVRAVNAYEPMRRALRLTEWAIHGYPGGPHCPICGGNPVAGHKHDCSMSAALRAADGEPTR